MHFRNPGQSSPRGFTIYTPSFTKSYRLYGFYNRLPVSPSPLDPYKLIYELPVKDNAAENRTTQLAVDTSDTKQRMIEMYFKIKATLTAKLHTRSDFSLATVRVRPRKIYSECFESLKQTSSYHSRLFKGFKEEDMQFLIAGKIVLKWLEIIAEKLLAEVKDKVIEDIISILKTAFKCKA